jgi:hypothetical protein
MSVFANELLPLDLTKMQKLAERYGIKFLPQQAEPEGGSE